MGIKKKACMSLSLRRSVPAVGTEEPLNHSRVDSETVITKRGQERVFFTFSWYLATGVSQIQKDVHGPVPNRPIGRLAQSFL